MANPRGIRRFHCIERILPPDLLCVAVVTEGATHVLVNGRLPRRAKRDLLRRCARIWSFGSGPTL